MLRLYFSRRYPPTLDLKKFHCNGVLYLCSKRTAGVTGTRLVETGRRFQYKIELRNLNDGEHTVLRTRCSPYI